MTELQTLKYLIEDPKWILYTHDELYQADHLRLKKVLNQFAYKGRPVSLSALRVVLRDKPDVLRIVDQLEGIETDKALFLVQRDELREQAKLRILNQIAQVPLIEAKAYKQALKDLQALEEENKPEELSKAVNFKDWSQHIQPEMTYLDSGLVPLLDTGTDFKRGDLVNLLAASGNMKTGTMTHIARHQILQGRNILFFSMEETSQSLLARIGMGILGLTPYQYSQLTPDELESRFSSMNLGNLDVISGKIIYIEDLQQQIQDLEEERGYKYDYIIPDYSAMIEVKNASKQMREDQKISKIFRELKLIAMDVKSPKVILTAIQSNREGYGKKKSPNVENTSGSMGGVHTADLMIALKYKVNPDAPIRETPATEQPGDVKGFVKLTIRKKRTGTIREGDSFIFQHLACGTIEYQDRMTTDMANFEQWDNLFETDD